MTRRWLCVVGGLLLLYGLYLWTNRKTGAALWGPRETPPAEAFGSENPRLLEERPLRDDGGVAVLLLRPDQEALAAARVLEAAGLPFGVTKDLSAAVRHPLVFIPSGDRSIRPDAQEKKVLRDFVEGGGTLVLQTPPDLMREFTGLHSEKPRRSRRALSLQAFGDEGFALLDAAELRDLPLASPATRQGIWTHGLVPASGLAQGVASFETREAAIVRRKLGLGRVYTLGFDLRDLVLRPPSGRHFDASRGKGRFDPSVDAWTLVFRGWYAAAVGGRGRPARWARLRGLPGDASGLLALTHAVGWGASIDGAEEFLALEQKRGVRATWFVQTKYVTDVLPAPMFDAGMRRLLRKISASGHEIASHSVAHGPDLSALSLGTGEESMKDYRPRLDARGRTHGGTLLGELCLSRGLLREAADDAPVKGFRAPFLSFPVRLDAGLARCGYAWDSSVNAAWALTYRPYRMLRGRAMERESSVREFPMALEDEDAPSGFSAPEKVLALLRSVSSVEGTFVWLLHPDRSPGKAAALEKVLAGLPRGTRTTTLSEAAAFEEARAATRFTLEEDGPAAATLRVAAPAGSRGLSFELSAPVRACSSKLPVRCAGRVVVLEEIREEESRVRLNWK
ncbi:MAG: polysaccharide deacetylase family protein [Elusimicrobiota bacterium]|jgi:peptidoglycan/xylan/chitin deacetylase (PgdA/CDA1 family)